MTGIEQHSSDSFVSEISEKEHMSPKNVICTFHSNWKFAKSNKSKNLHNLKCRNMQQSQKHFSVSVSLSMRIFFLVVCVNPLG